MVLAKNGRLSACFDLLADCFLIVFRPELNAFSPGRVFDFAPSYPLHNIIDRLDDDFTMEVVLYPHPALKAGTQPVLKVTKSLRAQVQQMFDLMYANKGIGLAGPQVNLPYRVVVINLSGDPEKKEREMVLINPVIVHRSGKLARDEEGCLSFPGIYAPVVRPSRCVVKAFTLQGEPMTATMENLAARCVQHECDHLDGFCFIDRLEPEELKKIQPKLDELAAKAAMNQIDQLAGASEEKPAEEKPAEKADN